MEISISLQRSRIRVYRFFFFKFAILFLFSGKVIFTIRKFSFSRIELFSKGNGIYGDGVCTVCTVVEPFNIFSFRSFFLSFSLSFYSTPLHTSFYSPPPRKFQKSQTKSRDIVSEMTNTQRCFGVLSREKFVGGRHFGRCLFNQVWRTTRSRLLGRLNLLSLLFPPPPGDVVISVSSWGKFALFKHQAEILANRGETISQIPLEVTTIRRRRIISSR